MTTNIEQAINALREGKFVLIFDSDSREAETDMVIASEKMTPESIRTMRKDAGGLICTTVPAETWEKLDLPYLAELFVEAYNKHPGLRLLAPTDLPYDTKSAFGITINHRRTFTGIPDHDRALTISEFAKLGQRVRGMTQEEAKEALGKDFRAPGPRIPPQLSAWHAGRPQGAYRTGVRPSHPGRDVSFGHGMRDARRRWKVPPEGKGSRVC